MEPSPFQQGIESMRQFQAGGGNESDDDPPYDVEEVDPSHDVYDEVDSYVPRKRRQGNTGPKGVLADYAEAQERLRIKNNYEAALAKEKLGKMSHRARTIDGEQEVEKLEEEEELLDELDSDDDFMMEYKAKRMHEIRQQLNQTQKATFGSVNVDQYLEAIDDKKSSAFIVLHLDQSYLPGCKQVNDAFSVLAQKYPTTLFLRMNSDKGGDYPDETLPVILIYKDQKLLHNILPLHHFIERPFQLADIEKFLKIREVL